MKWLKYVGVVLISLLLFCSGSFFYYFLNTFFQKNHKGLNIQQDFYATTEIKSDLLKTSLDFSASPTLSTKAVLSQEDKRNIERIFDKINTRVKESNICYPAGYSIQPTFDYKDGKEVPNGQRVSFSIQCAFHQDKLSEYKKVLEDLNHSLENQLMLSIPILEPSITQEQLQEAQLTLRNDLFEKIENTRKNYETILKKRCKTSRINLISQSADSSRQWDPNNQQEIILENQKNKITLGAAASFRCN